MENMRDRISQLSRILRKMKPSSSEFVSGTLERDDGNSKSRSQQSSDSSSERVASYPNLRVGKHDSNVVVEVGAAGGKDESQRRG